MPLRLLRQEIYCMDQRSARASTSYIGDIEGHQQRSYSLTI